MKDDCRHNIIHVTGKVWRIKQLQQSKEQQVEELKQENEPAEIRNFSR
jgi:hypothetical protein